MRKTFFVLFFMFLFSIVFYPESQKIKLAIELFEIMKIKDNFIKSFPIIKETQKETLKKILEKDDNIKDSEEILDKVMNIFEEEFSIDKFIDKYIEIYAEIFTVEDLQELIEFYQSRIGQKLIENNSIITQRSLKITQELLLEIMPKIKEELSKEDI